MFAKIRSFFRRHPYLHDYVDGASLAFDPLPKSPTYEEMFGTDKQLLRSDKDKVMDAVRRATGTN